MPALSIRQPYAEQILRGTKRIEYRSMSTNKRGRVYIYAGQSPGPSNEWRKIGLEAGDLPTGVLVGTVEIIDCIKKGTNDYHWILAHPLRLKRTIKPTNHPQTAWFYPF
ncbi:MAG TPA: ASCH domain-containing protein [Pyrinomonadaceae bacterium]|nr:ASCH domain-containing protein [Pyrinomonadaceae bacterium]